ncbi:MAG: hypothetical protein R3281_02520, partial [Balneolaceae bacterium]|nr:hypothetical protein [Balneolaceae bacterium]
MRYLKYTLSTALIFLVAVACEVNSDKFPTDLEEIHKPENTGGFARVVNAEGAVWNVLDLSSGEYTVTLEIDDAQNGGQLESVEFYVGFFDNSAQNIGDIEANPSNVFRTLEAGDFSASEETGLPRATTSFTSSELANQLGIDLNNVGINATFALRWQLNMTNGKTFGPTNSGSNITGGAFYNSPFAQNINVSLEVPSDQFVGTYEMVQNAPVNGGAIGGFGDGWLFGDDDVATVEISVNPDNPLNGRVFDTDEGGYLDALGFGTEIDPIEFALTR